MAAKKAGKVSRRYGKRFSSPYSSWSCGHRRNPTRKKGGRRNKPVIVIGKG